MTVALYRLDTWPASTDLPATQRPVVIRNVPRLDWSIFYWMPLLYLPEWDWVEISVIPASMSSNPPVHHTTGGNLHIFLWLWSVKLNLIFRASQEEEVSDPRRWGYASATGTVINNEVAARLSSSVADYEFPIPSYGIAASTVTPASSSYSHNTYHGQVRHQRAPLNMENAKPLRFIDNPPGQYSTSVLASYHQRRRSSNASNDSEVSTPFTNRKRYKWMDLFIEIIDIPGLYNRRIRPCI